MTQMHIHHLQILVMLVFVVNMGCAMLLSLRLPERIGQLFGKWKQAPRENVPQTQAREEQPQPNVSTEESPLPVPKTLTQEKAEVSATQETCRLDLSQIEDAASRIPPTAEVAQQKRAAFFVEQEITFLHTTEEIDEDL